MKESEDQKKVAVLGEKDVSKEEDNATNGRVKELEEELKKLLAREEQRKADYEEKMKSYELYAGEQAINKEAEETKKTYNSFDLDKELENDLFVKLLKNGFDVKTAYEATHVGEIIAEAKRTAKSGETKKRPLENGTAKGGGALLKSGVYALTKKEREELAKRTQKGETIRF